MNLFPTSLDFANTFNPSAVGRVTTSISGGSILSFVDPSTMVLQLAIPDRYGVSESLETAESPSKLLVDRLRYLKTQYSEPFLADSKAPSDAAFQNARDFVLTLPLNRISKPTVHVASDGEVNFHWLGADFQIDLGFYGDGTFSFYGSKAGRDPLLGDAIPVRDGIPQALAEFASSI